jgi:YidC/Oxa1 family membrane protein insertase
MQQKNFVIFMITCLVILVGWMWLQNQIWPPRPRPKDDKRAAEKKKKEKEKEKEKAPVIALPWLEDVWPKLSEGEKLTAAVSILPSSFSTLSSPFSTLPSPLCLGLLFDSKLPTFLAVNNKLKFKTDQPKVQTFILGATDKTTPQDKRFFITAVFTNRGAGIQQVTLNNFEGADRLGLGTGQPLHLVQEDPFYPSFLMYHFTAPGKDQDEYPVETLGRKIWKYEGTSDPDGEGAREIRFSTTAPAPFDKVAITKIYRLGPRDYHIGLTLEIKNTSGKEIDLPFRYQLAGSHGTPIEGEWYTNIFRNSVIGMVDGRKSLWRSLEEARQISFQQGGERVPEAQRASDSFIQYAGVMTQYFASLIVVDNVQEGVDMKSILAWARPTLETTQIKGKLVSVAADKKSFVVDGGRDPIRFTSLPRIEDSLGKLRVGTPVIVGFYRDREKHIATHIRQGQELHPFTDDITVRVNSEPIELKPDQPVTHKFLLYHGPVKVNLLNQLGSKSPPSDLVSRYADTLHLKTLTDYGSFGIWTNILITCTRFMHWLLNLLNSVVPVYGLSIILLTVVVRGLMFPISRKQAYLSIKMAEIAPEMKKLQEKYKNDSKARTEAIMELYRKHQVHPLGGCLPLLLQMPIFLGLYYCLQESIHFRLASFLWIPNLAAPDMLFKWGEGIPIISDPDNQHAGLFSILYLGPFLNILPIFAVALMIVQQKLLTPPPADEQQAMTQKMMKYMMVFFGVMFYKVAAGLCLYFIASSLWGVMERKMLPKKPTPGTVPATAAPAGKPPPGSPRAKQRPGAKKEVKSDGAMQKLKDWWADVLKKAKKQ